MKNILLRSLCLTFLLLCGYSLTGCRHGSRADIRDIEQCDSLPSSVKKLVKAVAEADSVSFASIVSYPLERPYPLRNIESAEEMKSYYSTLVDDSLQQAITGSNPADWEEYGWRGRALRPYIWIDSELYAVPYVSVRERHMLDSLISLEMGSIGKEFSAGWKPEMCLRATEGTAVFRIDSSKEPAAAPRFRLLIWSGDADLKARPDHSMTGYRDTEGTAGTRIYHFTDSLGNAVRFSPDIPDGTLPAMEFADSVVEVLPVYWLDLINQREE